ncbi:MAG: hypothetical protein ACWGMY_09015 [Hyphomicrobiaceae bacterium]
MSFHTYVTAINHDNHMLAARIAAAGSIEERIVLIGDNANGRIAFSISLVIEDQGVQLASPSRFRTAQHDTNENGAAIRLLRFVE